MIEQDMTILKTRLQTH